MQNQSKNYWKDSHYRILCTHLQTSSSICKEVRQNFARWHKLQQNVTVQLEGYFCVDLSVLLLSLVLFRKSHFIWLSRCSIHHHISSEIAFLEANTKCIKNLIHSHENKLSEQNHIQRNVNSHILILNPNMYISSLVDLLLPQFWFKGIFRA